MTDTLSTVSYSVGTKGQVVIPKEIRDALHIRPGQEIEFEQRGDEVILRKAASEPLLGRFAGRDLTAALAKERQEERQRDDRRS
jgi:AbrB family looped-hinge helix DNA binding protein